MWQREAIKESEVPAEDFTALQLAASAATPELPSTLGCKLLQPSLR